ncbi:hypothetical protein LOZ39_000587 [Ophidiomyces ophidiicola]|uniref:uncharacterized protein n=1 Tax=Ophidiomyces ophidiicola TaxID=1387563 RepID=UPI0020C429A7|nr:uncharacterized protein LOZ57_001721 [Ophidiomyces ophidiicola]KAI1951168.1 hypothetical protein LOZ57_001721 [Ophidiomyces ophidiicola]KAI2012651.1 hypothetical protein LOZ50_000110 [Ophidiomyces ophidiicola]KAI2015947.1 hypothetical protein LOZ49_000343 [Ophidiomyces ophidiicola]KAI2057223.1 hypothetical protein LOZ44_001561 [Ophidiomyces ophidiicola]KAI2060120.1 hypothetical protein LOZ43_001825 [Ophidiomyces ophidiicola]
MTSYARPKFKMVFDDDEEDHRIRVDIRKVEPGKRRFPRGSNMLPEVAEWRNNLTALSQHRNLYFVASMRQVYVYQPASSSVGSKPALILTPTLKEPAAPGFISHSCPHAINHIVVGDLGNEEIVLLATDSGNIAAYWTERIFSALEHSKSSEPQSPEALGAIVPCFFSDWVKQSAWGLAIHKFARMIAASSNTSEITVWAFALAEQAESMPAWNLDYTDEWSDVTTATQFAALRLMPAWCRRSRSIRITLRGHYNNIPCVGFLSSEIDRNGEWLVSTDITNRLLVWRIWESPNPLKEWDLNHPWQDGDQNYTADSYDRGWSVLALDNRSFRIKRSIREACGGHPFSLNDYSPYDLTPLIHSIPDASTTYIVDPPNRRNQPQHDQAIIGLELSDNFFEDSDQGDGDGDGLMTLAMNPNVGFPVIQATPTQPENMPLPTATENGPGTEEMNLDAHELIGAGGAGEVIETEEDFINDDDDDDDDGTYLVDALLERLYGATDDFTKQSDEPAPSMIDSTILSNLRYLEEKYGASFSILHLSEADVQFLPSQFCAKPSVYCRMVLRQTVPALAPILQNYDRFNMVHQIPELGVVIAASQKGRVAIISLTQGPEGGRYMRVDNIVPFESQERLGQRPLVQLLGIAVGPIESNLIPVEADLNNQSDADSETHPRPFKIPSTPRESWHGSQYSRKYRLILTYFDHTVLWYELSYDWPAGVLGVNHDDRIAFTLAP